MLVIHSRPVKYDISKLSLEQIKDLLFSLNFDLKSITDQYLYHREMNNSEEDERIYLITYLTNQIKNSSKQLCITNTKLKQSFWIDTIFKHNTLKRVSSYSEFIECYLVDKKKYEYSLIDQQWSYKDNILSLKKYKEFNKYRRIFQFLDLFYNHTLIRKLDNLDSDIITIIVTYYYKINDKIINKINDIQNISLK